MKSFTADCGHIIPALPDGHTGGTGYGKTRDGKTRCYDCCALETQESMRADGRAVLYVGSRYANGHTGIAITDWPGKLRFDAFNITKSEGYGFGTRYQITSGRFRGPDGKLWAFRNAGDNDIARCKRLKDAR